jgi:hypothetical protein
MQTITLSYADYDLKNVISKLESDSQKMLDWFANNLMQPNPDKFQALAIVTLSDGIFDFSSNSS